MTAGTFRLGASSWSSPDRVGPLHPPGSTPEKLIAHDAARYDTVEIDATCYRPWQEGAR